MFMVFARLCSNAPLTYKQKIGSLYANWEGWPKLKSVLTCFAGRNFTLMRNPIDFTTTDGKEIMQHIGIYKYQGC